jgi:hypothetical protein
MIVLPSIMASVTLVLKGILLTTSILFSSQNPKTLSVLSLFMSYILRALKDNSRLGTKPGSSAFKRSVNATSYDRHRSGAI